MHIATAYTKHMDTSTVTGIIGDQIGFYKGKGTRKFFVPGHAYSISEVEPENKMITLANPWNTSKPIKLSFRQFKETFSGIEAIRIDSARLLENIETVVEKAS